MSGLRDAVTGSDACTANGAGPSNPLAGIADTLLGTSSKTRTQLHEYARTGAAPPGLARPQAAPLTPADAVRRLAGPSQPIPQGLSTQPFPPPPQLDDLSRTFEQVYLEATSRPAPHARGPSLAAPPQHTPVFASLHSFLRAPPHAGPRPPPQLAPPPPLSVPEKVQIRDRSTILARHLFADHGDAVAAAHADSLLATLGISAAELPPRVGRFGDSDAWQQVWQQQQQAHPAPPEPSALQQQHLSHHRHAPAAAAAGGAWADAFATQHRAAAPPQVGPAAWAEEFAERGGGAATATTGDTWAGQFQDARADVASGTAADAAMVQNSKTLAGVLARDPDNRFKDSQFLQFLSKMSEGGSEFVAAAADAPPAQQWATEFAAGPGAAWADTFAAQQRAAGAAGPDSAAADAWAQDFAAQQQHIQQRDAAVLDTSVADAWAEDFTLQQRQQEAMDLAWADIGLASAPERLGLETEYVFQEGNRFEGDPNAMQAATRAFQHGSLSEACLALEAVVKANPENAQAWRMLGTAHAENDDDRQAIAAMGRALRADPHNPAVLLALGVSHVNELQEGQAVQYLMRWLAADPARAAAIDTLEPPDRSQALPHAKAAFTRATAAAPQDADLQTALGVICHLSGDFVAAAAAFERALAVRPQEYSLWNKLGATLANSNRSAQAQGAYARALQCKPNYMRAWANLGISHGNLGQYGDAARYYLKALSLNPRGDGVWGYLKTAVVLMGRMELVAAVDARDVGALTTALGVGALEDVQAAAGPAAAGA